MGDFGHFFGKLFESPAVKTLTGFVIWLISIFFGDFRPAYGIVAALVVLDSITGIYFAWVDPNQKIVSSRLRSGAAKILIYATLLSVGHICSQVNYVLFVQALIEGYIMITEVLSVLENCQKISALNGTEIPFLDKLMKFIQGKMDKMGS